MERIRILADKSVYMADSLFCKYLIYCNQYTCFLYIAETVINCRTEEFHRG